MSIRKLYINWILIGLTLCFFAPAKIFSQDHNAIHKKYWYYRYRLKNHFTKVGKLQGESLIVAERAGYDSRTDLSFGDQTTTLGQYIAILALEYHFLAENNQNTDETLDELFHAMWAFNRLDINAESLFRSTYSGEPNPQPGDLNGFFVKDDGDDEFFQENINHFNSDKISSDKLVSTFASAWKYSTDGFNQGAPPGDRTWGNAEQSQDQVFYIMFGMAMVHHLIPDGIIYNNEIFQDGIADIKEESEAIMLRIVSHHNGTSDPNRGTWYAWDGYNPIWDIPTGQSASTWQWSYGVANAACLSTGVNIFNSPCTNLDGILPSYHNAYSTIIGPLLWPGFRNFFLSQDNSHMVGMLNALNGRSNGTPGYAANILFWDIQHVPLIRQVLYGGVNPFFSNQSYTDMLEEAPCEGPYYFDWATNDVSHIPGGGRSFEWSSSDRVLHPERRGGNTQNSIFPGEFPGIDFMLYHNLYYYVQDSYYASPINMMTQKIDVDLPYQLLGTDVGTTTFPYLLESFGSITACNEIDAQGSNPADGASDVTYRAGCEVKLQTGFHVEAGSNFHAYIERFTCGSDGGYKMAVQDSTNVALQSAMVNLRTHNEKQPFNVKTFNFDESDPEMYDESEDVNSEQSLGMLGWVYPNPAQDELEIRIPEELKELPYRIEVYSMLSSKLAEYENYQGTTIDVSSFPRGLCIFRFVFGEGEFELSEKIILE